MRIVRCKLEANKSIIQEVMKLKYLGIQLSGFSDAEAEVSEQTTRARKINGCLLAKKSLKLRLNQEYIKLFIRPIMTNTAESRHNKNQTIGGNNRIEDTSCHS